VHASALCLNSVRPSVRRLRLSVALAQWQTSEACCCSIIYSVIYCSMAIMCSEFWPGHPQIKTGGCENCHLSPIICWTVLSTVIFEWYFILFYHRGLHAVFGHLLRADPRQDHHRALEACIVDSPGDWRRRAGRPRQSWLRTVEADLRPMNLGLATAERRAQDRSAWRLLVATATSSTSSWRRRRYFMNVSPH